MSSALEGWLQIAARDLSEEAKQDIRKQLEIRFEAAYQSELVNGLPSGQASNAAVLQFGNPVQSNKEYKRKYLSPRQVKFLKQCLYTDADWKINLLILMVWILYGSYMISRIDIIQFWIPVEYVIYINLFFMCVYSFMVFYWLPQCKLYNISLASYLWISMLGYDLAYAAILLSFSIFAGMWLGGLCMSISIFVTCTCQK